MKKIAYRLAGVGDIAVLVQLRLDFLVEYGQNARKVSSLRPAIRKYFSTMLRAGAFVAAVAEVDGVIVGLSGMVYDRHPPQLKHPNGIYPYIMNVYVRPEFRRRGIATKLLKMLIREAKNAKANIVTLHFWPGKSELYAKVGFVPREREMQLAL